jgi:hypothetical protein
LPPKFLTELNRQLLQVNAEDLSISKGLFPDSLYLDCQGWRVGLNRPGIDPPRQVV